jgi:transcriptional regulator with XRE-family HTH domain
MNGTYFSNRLRIARETAGKTQAELAKFLETQNTTISNWEKGIREPNIATIQKIAEFLKCDIDYFFCTDKETQKLAHQLYKKRRMNPKDLTENSIGIRMFEVNADFNTQDMLRILEIKPQQKNTNSYAFDKYESRNFDLIKAENSIYDINGEKELYIDFDIVKHGEYDKIGYCRLTISNNNNYFIGWVTCDRSTRANFDKALFDIFIKAIKIELKPFCIENAITKVIIGENGIVPQIDNDEKVINLVFLEMQIPINCNKLIMEFNK